MLFTGHLTIVTINFLYNDSDHEIATPFRKHIEVYVVNNSACGSLYFLSYTYIIWLGYIIWYSL
jgi:hypothetical protein